MMGYRHMTNETQNISIISRLNWKLIIIHLFASFFIVASLREFSTLSDVEFLKNYNVVKVMEDLKN